MSLDLNADLQEIDVKVMVDRATGENVSAQVSIEDKEYDCKLEEREWKCEEKKDMSSQEDTMRPSASPARQRPGEQPDKPGGHVLMKDNIAVLFKMLLDISRQYDEKSWNTFTTAFNAFKNAPKPSKTSECNEVMECITEALVSPQEIAQHRCKNDKWEDCYKKSQNAKIFLDAFETLATAAANLQPMDAASATQGQASSPKKRGFMARVFGTGITLGGLGGLLLFVMALSDSTNAELERELLAAAKSNVFQQFQAKSAQQTPHLNKYIVEDLNLPPNSLINFEGQGIYNAQSNMLDDNDSRRQSSLVYMQKGEKLPEAVSLLSFLIDLGKEVKAFKPELVIPNDSTKLPGLPEDLRKLTEVSFVGGRQNPVIEQIHKFESGIVQAEPYKVFVVNDNYKNDFKKIVELHDEAEKFLLLMQGVDDFHETVNGTLYGIAERLGYTRFLDGEKPLEKSVTSSSVPPSKDDTKKTEIIPVNEALAFSQGSEEERCNFNPVSCLQDFRGLMSHPETSTNDQLTYATKILIYARRAALRHRAAIDSEDNWNILSLVEIKDLNMDAETKKIVDDLNELKKQEAGEKVSKLVADLTDSPWKWWLRMLARDMIQALSKGALYKAAFNLASTSSSRAEQRLLARRLCAFYEYRGHRNVYQTKEYTIFLDDEGNDHYQYSERNKHRGVRKHGSKWQYNSSSGWTDYLPHIQAVLNSEEKYLKKRKRDDPRVQVPATSSGGTLNTIPGWWSGLHEKIRKAKTYCYLRSRAAGPSIIDAFCSTEKYKNRNPNLDPSLISFEQSKYEGSEYNFFSTPSGNMLLVPPLGTGATDIKDFADTYGIDEWNLLYKEIMKRWKPGTWVDTEGHAVPYLHVRFEQSPLYTPRPDHTRL